MQTIGLSVVMIIVNYRNEGTRGSHVIALRNLLPYTIAGHFAGHSKSQTYWAPSVGTAPARLGSGSARLGIGSAFQGRLRASSPSVHITREEVYSLPKVGDYGWETPISNS
jgi:hypothetical protein